MLLLIKIAIIIGLFIVVRETKPGPLKTVFYISAFVGIQIYGYYRSLLSYLPLGLHILFYAIPVFLMLLVLIVYCLAKEVKLSVAIEEAKYWYICTIIAVWGTIPTLFLCYDWDDARVQYETEMKELLGDEWQEELIESETERLFR